MFLKLTFALSLVSLLIVTCSAVDSRAQEQCRTLHHTDVDEQGTAFSNGECLLTCVVHGRSTGHYINENGPCPGDHTGVCSAGQCINAVGYIDIEIESASVAAEINALVNVCIRNQSDPIAFPFSKSAHCLSCTTTPTPTKTSFAVWNQICTSTSKLLFSNQARVAFELGDHQSANSNLFVGGATFTIPQLLSHNDSHKKLRLALTGGHVAAQINARVTWTPNN